MAEAKEQVEWNRASMLMVNARLAMSNPDRVTVNDLLPRRYKPKPPKLTPEQEKIAKEKAWLILAQGMFGRR